MALSSNTLLHTTNKEAIYSILKDLSFYPKYCREELNYGGANYDLAFPMISFSDFPVTELKRDDIETYGKFGIGLRKFWATKNGLNPVMYIDSKSDFLKEFVSYNKVMHQARAKDWNNPALVKWYEFSYFTLAYFKNYQGHLKIPKLHIDRPNYRFSDEREWRYVPPKKILDKEGIRPFIPTADYLKEKPIYNNPLKKIRLSFSINDINYIIVDREIDIPQMIKHINDCYPSVKREERELLISRILSRTRIKKDF